MNKEQEQKITDVNYLDIRPNSNILNKYAVCSEVKPNRNGTIRRREKNTRLNGPMDE